MLLRESRSHEWDPGELVLTSHWVAEDWACGRLFNPPVSACGQEAAVKVLF